ncbi:diaminopropionate ammonia-lyase [Consotaella aegiceratis]|uniref:diaminopropionate ammonia-lyase n=1 Tax=Consotaella aegiceratis TaxID=3097961 RepID=UPI002F425146
MSVDYAAFDAVFSRNPRFSRQAYPERFKAVLSHEAAGQALEQISAWRGYQPTPLVPLADLAARLGIAGIHYKYEAGRFGLGSFKALGGAYAVFRLLAETIEAERGLSPSTADLLDGRYADIVGKVTVTCATDGNHGRSVAWGASLFGCQCVIFVHATVSEQRAEAIARYGAKVVRTKGNYDDSVREADAQALKNGWMVVSDTSYPGYTQVPKNVMQGYSVMAEEAIHQLQGLRPSHVFLQGGVGGLAAAVTAHLWEAFGEDAPTVVVVEPHQAACLLASNEAGEPKTVHGDLDTIMAGLACGEPSLIAWPILAEGVSAFMAIPDEAAAATMRLLASGEAGAKIVGGESGVAGLAGLLVLAEHPDWREEIGLTPTSRVLVIGSEGDTDPDLYRQIVGTSARQVDAGS